MGVAEDQTHFITPDMVKKQVRLIEKQMHRAAEDLEFEEAARLRDELRKLEAMELGFTSGSMTPPRLASSDSFARASGSGTIKVKDDTKQKRMHPRERARQNKAKREEQYGDIKSMPMMAQPPKNRKK